MAATKSFEDGLMEVEEKLEEKLYTSASRVMCLSVFVLMEVEEKLYTSASRVLFADTLDCCNLKPRMVVTRDDRARSKPSRCSYGPDLRCDHVLHLVVVQGLGSNYKSSGLKFHSTMILVLHLDQMVYMDFSLDKGLFGILELE
ncbi:hypothetical protein Tco_1148466 [Tanacetum coccineum]